MTIPFNKPYITGREADYVAEAIARGKLSANGYFSQQCSDQFAQMFGFRRTLMTTSCTSALEMAALLCGIESGDQVIMPSFTFVSTALAFSKFGAKIRFVDSQQGHPNMDCSTIEGLITSKTKAIVAVHYNGVPCDMDTICSLAEKYSLTVIEDTAHAINSPDCGRRGDLVPMSFHETKNIHCGEGGFLGINNEKVIERAEKLWLKGTNRLDFERGATDKYEWIDTGGSYSMSELSAAFLWGQITDFDKIITRRKEQWSRYYDNLKDATITLPTTQGSSHIFYLTLDSKNSRDSLVKYLGEQNILAPFHYQALHKSPYGKRFDNNTVLPNAQQFSDCLLRLPLYYELTDDQIDTISNLIKQWAIYTY